MKVCVFGAGAIGGYLGACLSRSGAEVSLVARGPHLEAIRAAACVCNTTGKNMSRTFAAPLIRPNSASRII